MTPSFSIMRWSADTSIRERTLERSFDQCLVLAATPDHVDLGWYPAHRRLQLAEEIQRLSQLREDWDAEGGSPVAPEAISMATYILNMLPPDAPLPEFAPNPNGTLSLYWSLPVGSIEIELGRTRHAWALLGRDGRASQVCSGENRALEASHGIVDLIAHLTPRADRVGTLPTSQITMCGEWAPIFRYAR